MARVVTAKHKTEQHYHLTGITAEEAELLDQVPKQSLGTRENGLHSPIHTAKLELIRHCKGAVQVDPPISEMQ